MRVKYELLQVYPPTDDWVVVYLHEKTFAWEKVYAMAQIRAYESYADERVSGEKPVAEDRTFEFVSPLILSTSTLFTLQTPEQSQEFGIWMEGDSFGPVGLLLHWSQVRAMTKGLITEDEGIYDWLEGKEAAGKLAKSVATIGEALKMLGFGNVHQPGAIEGHTMKMMQKYDDLSSAVGAGFTELAEAISNYGN